MVNKKQIFINSFFFGLLFITIVSALVVNTFQDGLTSGSLDFTGNQNISYNLSIYRYANISNAYLTLNSGSNVNWASAGYDMYNTRNSNNSIGNATKLYASFYSSADDIYVSASPITTSDYVYMAFRSGNVYQLNVSNISKIITNISGYATTTSPLYYNGYIFIKPTSGIIYQLNATNISQIINSKDLGGSGAGKELILSGNDLYATTYTKLNRLNISNISQVYEVFEASSSPFYSPAVANGYVYIGSDNKKVYQLNASNVSQIINYYNSSTIFDNSASYQNGYVYIADQNNLYQLNSTNISKLISSYPAGDVTPALSEQFILIGYNNIIYKLNSTNISQQIENYTANANFASISISGGYMFAMSSNNALGQRFFIQLDANNLSRLIYYNTADTFGGIGANSPAISNGCAYVSKGQYLYQFCNQTNFNVNTNKPYLEIGTPDSTYEWSYLNECSQPFANASTSCGGLSTGNYANDTNWDPAQGAINSLYDGNWDSYTAAKLNTNSYFYINYTKPYWALSSSRWEAKYGNNYENLSIPSDCWNYNTSLLSFRMMSHVTNLNSDSAVYCLNSTGWHTLNTSTSFAGAIYGDSMIWNWNISKFDTSIITSDLSSKLNSILYGGCTAGGGTIVGTNCSIPFLFHSDSAGVLGYSNINITWNESIVPLISIITPSNYTNTTLTQLNVNYTASDDNLQSCKYTRNNGVTNTTMTCGSNLTSITWNEGINNITIFVNDSSGNENSSSVRFRLDTTPPTTTASATSPAGGSAYTFNTWTKSNVRVVLSSADSGVGFNNLLYPLYCLDTSNTCNPSTYFTPNVDISTEGTSYIRYNATDLLGNSETIKSSIIKIDTTVPAISITTPSNNTNTTNTVLDINYTYSDASSGIGSCKWTKNSGVTNTSITCGTNLTGITWTEGKNNITIYINDSVGNENKTSITFTLDTINPNATLNLPINNTISNSAQNLSANVTDNLGIKNSTINVIDSYASGQFNGVNSKVNGTTSIASQLGDATQGTFSAWINAKSNNSNIVFRIFGDSLYPRCRVGSTGMLECQTSAVNSSGGVITSKSTYGTSVITNAWHFVTAVYNSSGTQSIYVDGIKESSDTFTNFARWKNGTSGFVLGFDSNLNIYMNGSMSNIAIFNRSLSSAEITTLYNNQRQPTNPITDGLVASYYLQTDTNDALGINNGTNINVTFSNIYSSTTSFASNIISSSVSNVFNLLDGIYKWFANVFDWSGNSYQTDNRTLTIDTVKPLISYNSNTDADALWKKTGDIFINVSSSDLHLDSVRLEFNGTNQSFSSNYFINKTGLSSGYYSFYAWANDTAGNLNTTSIRTVNIDLENPVVSIISPTSSSYNVNTSLLMNFTASDNNLALCFWNIDQISNTTITCNTSTTFDTSEGTHIIYAYAVDSAGRLTTKNVTFEVNLAPPGIVLNSPTDNKYINTNSLSFNYTPSDASLDTCQLWINSSGWHKNQSTTSPSTGIINNFSLNLLDGNYFWNVFCNDTGGNGAWGGVSNYTVHVDSLYPQIDFTTGTPLNNSNSTLNSIFVNVSVTELNEKNITFNLYNTIGSYNITTFTDKTHSINWTNLPNGNYTFNVTIYDLAENKNSTSTRKTTLDNAPPTIKIDEPKAQNYANNNTVYLNYTVSDVFIGVKQCWYYVYNSSSSLIIPTTVLSSCENTTFAVPSGDIDYILTLFAQDNLNNINTSSVTFGIRTNSPAISLIPGNNTQRNYANNHYFNFTVSTNAAPITSCQLWGDFNGTWSKNQTLTSVSTTLTNSFSPINLTETIYHWNVWCNDSLNNNGYGQNNQTYVVDLTYPLVGVPSVSSSAGTQTFTFNAVSSDTNLGVCKYTIFDSLGNINGLNNNITYTCNAVTSATVTAYGTYNLTVYTSDLALNENSSTYQFSISAGGVLGGGGGGGVTYENVTIIVGNANWTMLTEEGSNKYVFPLTYSGSVSRSIIFKNKASTEINVSLSCTGQLCSYLTLEKLNLTLPVGVGIPTADMFNIVIPDDVNAGTLIANIIGTDQKNLTNILTIQVDVGAAGTVLDTLAKVQNSTTIFGLAVPNLLILLLSSVAVSVFSYKLVFYKIKDYRAGISFILFVATFGVILIFLP